MTSSSMPSLVWGSPQWATAALALLGAAALALLLNYGTARASRRVRITALVLKAVGFSALALALIEPLLAGTRPRKGANAFVVLADNSQSLLVRDGDASATTRGDWARALLSKEAPWKARLGQDFDVRGYAFDTHLRAVGGFETLTFDGTASALTTSLSALGRRFRGLPLAGVLLVTDGNRTDTGDVDWSQLPPIYPVPPPSGGTGRDVGVTRLSVSQTNFEAAPVVVRADVSASAIKEPVVALVADEAGKVVERQTATPGGDGRPLGFRFQFRPEKKGVHFYTVSAFAMSDEPKPAPAGEANPAPAAREQTLANNSRLAVVDQAGGPYRVLYVGGRANWEFKFLRRALEEDEQVQLVGLVRIARRQPKFDFRDPATRKSSKLYTGFDNPDEETAERVDQPVLVRLGTENEAELRDGFPKTAEELFRYHAVILDDLEASFFTQDQLTLLRNFVSQRGGGLLMLGGPDSFSDGRYDRTPVGEILPVYLNRTAVMTPAAEGESRLLLTREGWLQPWVRLRKTEDEERKRLAGMPGFETLSRASGVKPGAVVLAQVADPNGRPLPALVAQQFGKGHVAALMLGDLWHWGMRRETPKESDLEKSWRQTIRWLVGDVPGRVDVNVRPKPGAAASAVEVKIRVNDAAYRPLDNAKVNLEVTRPGGDVLTLEALPDGAEPGAYVATYVPKQPGAYRLLAKAAAPDGSAVGERQAGWAAQPSADEFARLEPDRDYLRTLAAKTGGEVVDPARIDAFVATLPARGAPITEPWTSPLWHQPLYFLIAIGCLTAEWGLRRFNGLA